MNDSVRGYLRSKRARQDVLSRVADKCTPESLESLVNRLFPRTHVYRYEIYDRSRNLRRSLIAVVVMLATVLTFLLLGGLVVPSIVVEIIIMVYGVFLVILYALVSKDGSRVRLWWYTDTINSLLLWLLYESRHLCGKGRLSAVEESVMDRDRLDLRGALSDDNLWELLEIIWESDGPRNDLDHDRDIDDYLRGRFIDLLRAAGDLKSARDTLDDGKRKMNSLKDQLSSWGIDMSVIKSLGETGRYERLKSLCDDVEELSIAQDRFCGLYEMDYDRISARYKAILNDIEETSGRFFADSAKMAIASVLDGIDEEARRSATETRDFVESELDLEEKTYA